MAKKNNNNIQEQAVQEQAVQEPAKAKAPKITVNSKWARKDAPDTVVTVEDVSNKFVWFTAGPASVTEKLDKPVFRETFDKLERAKPESTGTGRAAKGEKERLLNDLQAYIMGKVREGLNLTAFRRNDNYIHAKGAAGAFEAWVSGSGFRVTMDPAREDFAELVEANNGEDLGEPNYRKGKTIVFFPEADIMAVVDTLLQ